VADMSEGTSYHGDGAFTSSEFLSRKERLPRLITIHEQPPGWRFHYRIACRPAAFARDRRLCSAQCLAKDDGTRSRRSRAHGFCYRLSRLSSTMGRLSLRLGRFTHHRSTCWCGMFDHHPRLFSAQARRQKHISTTPHAES
jgi:hypothetical protein